MGAGFHSCPIVVHCVPQIIQGYFEDRHVAMEIENSQTGIAPCRQFRRVAEDHSGQTIYPTHVSPDYSQGNPEDLLRGRGRVYTTLLVFVRH
jgi:hypothetical protein